MATATITKKPDLPTLLADLRATRARAEVALVELRTARKESEARMAQRPGGDTYKRVAGVSSLDRAIQSAERIVAAADRQLASLSSSASVETGRRWANAR
ncbi:MAG: hypothetical protein RIE77_02010 [Phycisphaerales bacterium]|jgi:hypothetical protein